jgi:hypothetical protein
MVIPFGNVEGSVAGPRRLQGSVTRGGGDQLALVLRWVSPRSAASAAATSARRFASKVAGVTSVATSPIAP